MELIEMSKMEDGFTERGLKNMIVETIKSLQKDGTVTQENCGAVTHLGFMIYNQIVYTPPEMIAIFNEDKGEIYNMITDMLIPDVGEDFAQEAYQKAVDNA
jgi:hypothetical protein